MAVANASEAVGCSFGDEVGRGSSLLVRHIEVDSGLKLSAEIGKNPKP